MPSITTEDGFIGIWPRSEGDDDHFYAAVMNRRKDRFVRQEFTLTQLCRFAEELSDMARRAANYARFSDSEKEAA